VTQLSADGEVITEEFDSMSTLQRSSTQDAARASRKNTKTETKADEEEDGGLLF
jgi:hypothetical protein